MSAPKRLDGLSLLFCIYVFTLYKHEITFLWDYWTRWAQYRWTVYLLHTSSNISKTSSLQTYQTETQTFPVLHPPYFFYNSRQNRHQEFSTRGATSTRSSGHESLTHMYNYTFSMLRQTSKTRWRFKSRVKKQEHAIFDTLNFGPFSSQAP